MHLLQILLMSPPQDGANPMGTFIMLGLINTDLRVILEGWGADFRDYTGGFYRLPTN